MNEPLEKSVRQWGMWCHLSGLAGILIGVIIPIPFLAVLVPCVVWQIGRDRHPFIDDQGREAINFQFSMSIYLVIAFILGLLLLFVTCSVALTGSNTASNLFGWAWITCLVFLALFGTFQLCVIILAAVKASQGQSYRYPFTIRFLQ
jgi:uncharacterized protein